ncbi:MAG: rod-binding protein [Lachnospiraceae bacterium]|nr:rod-binding protein [Lachnospiraceae bacterium]
MDPISSYINNIPTDPNSDKFENKLKADLSKSQDSELMSVCKEFEAYFTEQVFKAMDKMVPKSDMLSSSNQQLHDYYKGQLIQKYAEQSAEGEGLGIAKMLYEQMKRNYDIKE